MSERVLRLEQAIAEAVKLASPAMQEVVNGSAGIARHRADFGGDHRGRVGPDLSLSKALGS